MIALTENTSHVDSGSNEVMVCTLLEGRFFNGLAALCNSLWKWGYSGKVLVGYRGQLPTWLRGTVVERHAIDDQTLQVKGGGLLRLVRLDWFGTLTNLKPQWLMRCIELEKHGGGVAYFDTDIVLRAPWRHIEEWIDSGVALVQDIWPPLYCGHPRLRAWRATARVWGVEIRDDPQIYVNAGFVGVSAKAGAFLERWKYLVAKVTEAVGGMDVSTVTGARPAMDAADCGRVFPIPDQDALNMAARSGPEPVHLMGRDGMNFVGDGAALMVHAINHPKPWERRWLRDVLFGYVPRLNDVEFLRDWRHGPLRPYSPMAIWQMGFSCRLSRYYNRIVRAN